MGVTRTLLLRPSPNGDYRVRLATVLVATPSAPITPLIRNDGLYLRISVGIPNPCGKKFPRNDACVEDLIFLGELWYNIGEDLLEE